MTTNNIQFSNGTQLNSISLDRAIEIAPAIAADRPADYITNRYKFTSTKEVINMMQDLGYALTEVKQASTKIPLRRDFGAHIVQFQHPDLYIKATEGGVEARPQVVMINSHDGSRPISFEMGIFRLVCSNGLMIKSMDMGGFKERHTKLDFTALKNLINEKVETLPQAVNRINQFTSREMTAKERTEFAMNALRLRAGEEKVAETYELNSILSPRRDADQGTNLWKVFNTVQENLVRGGFQLNDRQARAITNPWADLDLNRELWSLAEAYVG
jgi:hypothetical protein